MLLSTDIHLFLKTSDFDQNILPHLLNVGGVEVDSQSVFAITGLHSVQAFAMGDRHIEIMRDDFGGYGQEFNWCVTGTLDKNQDGDATMERMYECAGAIVRQFPNHPLTLMNTATNRFYVYNSADRLVVSPYCLATISPDLFGKPYVEFNIDV